MEHHTTSALRQIRRFMGQSERTAAIARRYHKGTSGLAEQGGDGLAGQFAVVGETHGVAHAEVDDTRFLLFLGIVEDVGEGLQRVVELQTAAVRLNL